MKRISNILFCIAVYITTLSSCSNDNDDISSPDDEKTYIEMSGQFNLNSMIISESRSNNEPKGFSDKTKIAIHIISESQQTGIAAKSTTTTATVEQKSSDDATTSEVTFNDSEYRYWDDLHGYKSMLSIYAIGVQGKKGETGDYGSSNSLTINENDNHLAWTLSNLQNNTSFNQEDLLVSNNIKKTSDDNDNRIKYINNVFQKGNLLFTHALSKITVNLIKGKGFDILDPSRINLKLNGFYNDGIVDISTGTFDVTGKTKKDITASEPIFNNGNMLTYECLVIPSRNWDVDEPLLNITVNDNNYNVRTSNFNSILTGNISANSQYILNITINKTNVQVSASIDDWNAVSANLEPLNGQIMTFAELPKNFGNGFDLYLKETTKSNSAANDNSSITGYTKSVKTSFVWNSITGLYDYKEGYSPLYWPNNIIYYHFRAIAPSGHTIIEDTSNGDYVTLTSGQNYTDIIWGAPYIVNNGNTVISPALGAISNKIALSFYHMMAEINFVIKSETTDNNQKVDLSTAPNVVLNCFSTTKLRLKDKTTDAPIDRANYSLSATYGTTNYNSIGVVPQITSNNTLTITTADNNVYIINDLSSIKDNTTSSKIAMWKAGYKYTYTINLKKSKIDIQAQILDWKSVETNNEEVVIQ